MPACYRHPSRETGVSCSNCGRPICPDCMTPTSVGMRCPECAGQRTRVHRMPTGSGHLGKEFVWSDPRTWTVTQALIIVNVACFVAELATGGTLGGVYRGWTYVHGVLFGPFMSDGDHQYWRLLTSGFMHASLLHIATNMLSLWFVGRALEPAIGRLNFALIYFAALLAGSFGALAFTPDIPSLGASTGIFGVFGALIAVAHARRIPLWQSGLMPVLLLNLVFTLTIADVSVGGHVGGLIAGVLCGRAYVDLFERQRSKRAFYGVCVLVMAVSVVGAILVAGGPGLIPNGAVL